ncbi:DUF6273 domain-containing protein [uncultured Ruminococcus sp.]|uniref:DUF6273 domain-containing protein n=1 Tax=uncultured Ruminococcus sp. TaxID=165186 RepID=UPI0025E3DA36|nr:DUF6273 domain-containing protein [uncultured Ruminococcus sp.]
MKAILRRTTTMLCAAVMAMPMALSVYAFDPNDPSGVQTDTSGVSLDNSAVISNEPGSSIGGGDTDQTVTSSDYTITIPATFDIKNSGWNEIGEIKAGGTLEEDKKLVVTATSANDWALRSGENEVRYEMMNYEDDSAPATSWEFTDLPASQSIGINVEDYSGKPAGSYTDTVTFTASVTIDNPYEAANIYDVVSFGGYDWYVINKRDDGVTLLMKKSFIKKGYNDEYVDVTWETCTLRAYLNNEFYNSFSDDDKAKIALTHNTNPNNDTDDYIYLLSTDEAEALDNSIRDIGEYWWLRSPGGSSDRAVEVYPGGRVYSDGYAVPYEDGVRPALNLKF